MKKNFWIRIEIVVITIVAWAVLDCVIVKMWQYWQPWGFDNDRLVCVDAIKRHAGDVYLQDKEYKQLMEKLQQLPEVESLCQYAGIGNGGSTYMNYVLNEDTVSLHVSCTSAENPGFSTYGIKVIEGDVSDILSVYDNQFLPVAITRSTAVKFYGTTKVIGRIFTDSRGETKYRIIAVVEDIRHKIFSQATCGIIEFLPIFNNGTSRKYTLCLRLRSDMNPRRFLAEYTHRLNSQEFQAESYYLRNFMTFKDMQRINGENEIQQVRYYLIMTIFFFISLCLGTIGTFWMQTKRRTDEIAIRRAFGATRWHILGMFLREGAILTTISAVLGYAIQLNYLMKYNNWDKDYCSWEESLTTPWFLNFSTHFTVVSILIYLLLLTVVSIGIAIPAWRASRTHIVDTLK